MDLSHHPHARRAREKVHQILSWIPASGRSPTFDAGHLRQIRGLLWILSGLLLCFGAHRRSLDQGATTFFREHPLPATLWRLTLSAYRFREVSLRQGSAADTKIRISKDGGWIEFPAGIPGVPAGIRAREGESHPPAEWFEAGSGLQAYENWLERLESRPNKPPMERRLPVKTIDPKEIRY
jgi:hypothetical protein